MSIESIFNYNKNIKIKLTKELLETFVNISKARKKLVHLTSHIFLSRDLMRVLKYVS